MDVVPRAKVPTDATLRRYGLSREEWLAILERQGGVCAVCERLPASQRLNVDHEHVRGWAKRASEERKRFVRGLLCYQCNYHLANRVATIAKAERLARYLRDYQSRAYGAGGDLS